MMNEQLRIEDFMTPGTRILLTIDDAGVYYATWYEWDAEELTATGETTGEALHNLAEAIYQGDIAEAYGG